jgi:predicted nucleic acid-binding Zn ribbon protein
MTHYFFSAMDQLFLSNPIPMKNGIIRSKFRLEILNVHRNRNRKYMINNFCTSLILKNTIDWLIAIILLTKYI